MIFLIGDMLAIGVEATITPLGFGVTMSVCALLCLGNFETIVILLAFKDKSILVLHVIAIDH